MTKLLRVSRTQVLAYRRRVGALDERLPKGARSLRQAAWAGLQDSMPRAALLSIHARVEGATPMVWNDRSLVQVWGPRYSAFVVAKPDSAIFTLGRMPAQGPKRERAEKATDRLHKLLGSDAMIVGEAGRALGVSPNSLRYATLTGRVLIHWDGARQPTIRLVPPPDIERGEALLELARRYLHVFGPSTEVSFARWAGVTTRQAATAFEGLAGSLIPVTTPLGDASILAADEEALRAPTQDPAIARLLPSGDSYYLLQGPDRELLVPRADQRDRLWTSRVWPGAILSGGEIIGTWRRSKADVTLSAWKRLTRAVRAAIADEAEALPLPDKGITVTWE